MTETKTTAKATKTAAATTAPVAKTKKRSATRGPLNDLHGMIQGLYTFALPKHVNVEFARRRGDIDEAQAAVAIRNLLSKIGRHSGILNKRSEPAVNLLLDICIERVPGLAPQAEEIKGRISYSTNKGSRKNRQSWMATVLEGKVARMKDGRLYRLIEMTEDEARKQCEKTGQAFPEKKAE